MTRLDYRRLARLAQQRHSNSFGCLFHKLRLLCILNAAIWQLQQENNIQPTTEQGFACICVCQWLSNGFQPIYVFRFDDKSGEIFILAGVNEGIEIIVFRDGLWEFSNNEQTEF